MTMFRILIIVAIAFFIQCCSHVTYRINSEKSAQLNEYIAMFHEEMDKRKVYLKYDHISIRFVERLQNRSHIAVAYPFMNQHFIDVLKNYYQNAPAEEQEAIVIHEIGHVFGLNHLDTMEFKFPYEKSCPVSVMHSESRLTGCYFLNRVEYFDELATRIKKVDNGFEL